MLQTAKPMQRPADDALQIPISALNQYAYCPRRCYLIHVEGEFRDNVHTISGTLEQERVDQQAGESKAGVRVEYALPIWSDALGLSGRCDAVEFHPDGTIYPVEHKHGKRRQWENDVLQLAAQAFEARTARLGNHADFRAMPLGSGLVEQRG